MTFLITEFAFADVHLEMDAPATQEETASTCFLITWRGTESVTRSAGPHTAEVGPVLDRSLRR